VRFNNAVFGVLIALFSVAVWVYSGTFPEMPGQAYGPSLFPRLIAAGLFVCGIGLVLDGIRTVAAQGLVDLDPWTCDRGRVINVLLIPVALLCYIGLSDRIGFLPLTWILLTALLWRFGARPVWALMIAAITTVFVHILFYQFLHVPLPWGVLEQYAW